MATLLIGGKTYRRLAAELSSKRPALDCLLLEEDGGFGLADGTVVEGTQLPAFQLAYGNEDTLMGPAGGKFIKTVITSGGVDWLQSFAAGTEHPAIQGLGRSVQQFSTCHVQAEAMAEWALWGALDFFRRGPDHRADQAAERWERRQSRELNASRWLIHGFGAVGAAVGRRVRALGGQVTGIRRSVTESPDADLMIPALTDAALATTDVFLLAVPHTPQTDKLVNAELLARLRPETLLMNLGRGGLIDEPALLAALDAGRPAYAWLDVASVEPLPAGNPLWSHPKVTLTPHDSPATAETGRRQDQFFLKNLDRYLAGQVPLNLVDPASFVAAAAP